MQNTVLPEGFMYVRDLIPDVLEIMAYATGNNFVGAPIDGYRAPRAVLTRKAVQALEIVSLAAHVDGYRLAIFDAYRPARAVRHFMRWAQDAADTRTQAAYYPEFEDKQALKPRPEERTFEHSPARQAWGPETGKLHLPVPEWQSPLFPHGSGSSAQRRQPWNPV